MTDVSNLCVYTTERDGKWLAATRTSPFFCFEAESEEAALSIAAKALEYYVSAHSRIQAARTERSAVAPVWHAKSARELQAA